MATYVLVPGAWLGGWAWSEVTDRLRELGHDVYPITLTGLGEREHLARPEIDLETHISDVVNTVTWNDLEDVILAGHSYAGVVITGVADRIPQRTKQLVYVDSSPLPGGMGLADLFPDEARQGLQETVDTSGDGWKLPYPGFAGLAADASVAGIGEEAKQRLEAKASAQPWRTWTQPLRLENEGPVAYGKTVIACDDVRGMVAAGIPSIVQLTQAPWRYIELDTGHWPMLSTPRELAELLSALGS